MSAFQNQDRGVLCGEWVRKVTFKRWSRKFLQFVSYSPTWEKCVKGKVNVSVQQFPVVAGRAWSLKKTICLPWGKKRKDNGHISKGLTPRCNPNKNDDTVIETPGLSSFPSPNAFCSLNTVKWRQLSWREEKSLQSMFRKLTIAEWVYSV